MRRPRQRRGAQRRFIQAPPAVDEAAAVAPEHLDIGQQMVAEGDGLSGLQVREARHDRGRILLGAIDQGGLQVGQHEFQPIDGVAHPQADVERHLVVARAGGVQAAASRADQLGEAGLDVEMDVLELGRELEAPALDLLLDLDQAAPDRRAVLAGEDALGHQHLGVRQRARDVLRIEPLVEADGDVDALHDFRRPELVAAAPHRVGAALRRSRSRVLSCHELEPSIL